MVPTTGKVNSIRIDGNLYLTTSTGPRPSRRSTEAAQSVWLETIRAVGLVDNFPLGNVTETTGFADADNGGIVVIVAAADITLNTDRTFRDFKN